MKKDKSVSPTMALDLVFTTAAIAAAGCGDAAIVDPPRAYLRADIDIGKEVLIML